MQTRIHFIEELSRLNHDVLSMGARVEESLRQALEALKTQNVDLAQEVKARDELINAMQLKIEDQAAVLIATQQPVARDLRFLTAAIKINADLERMGDLAVNIVERALSLIYQPPVKPLIDIPQMAKLVESMVRRSLDAFVKRDPELARAVLLSDDAVDELRDAIYHLSLIHI